MMLHVYKFPCVLYRQSFEQRCRDSKQMFNINTCGCEALGSRSFESNNWLHAYARTAEREALYRSRLSRISTAIGTRISTAALAGRRNGRKENHAMAAAGSEEEHKTMPDLRMMYQLSNDLQYAQQRQYQQIFKRNRQKWLEIVGAPECMVRVRQAAS
jgi:hypothetical protein